jgi:hypothetical protein
MSDTTIIARNKRSSHFFGSGFNSMSAAPASNKQEAAPPIGGPGGRTQTRNLSSLQEGGRRLRLDDFFAAWTTGIYFWKNTLPPSGIRLPLIWRRGYF